MLAVAIAASWLEGLLDYFWSQPAVARKATTASNGSPIKTRGLGGRTKEMQKKLTAKSTVSISFARSVPPLSRSRAGAPALSPAYLEYVNMLMSVILINMVCNYFLCRLQPRFESRRSEQSWRYRRGFWKFKEIRRVVRRPLHCAVPLSFSIDADVRSSMTSYIDHNVVIHERRTQRPMGLLAASVTSMTHPLRFWLTREH